MNTQQPTNKPTNQEILANWDKFMVYSNYINSPLVRICSAKRFHQTTKRRINF
jgi:hypothetical protein